jgi:hypothetical protein
VTFADNVRCDRQNYGILPGAVPAQIGTGFALKDTAGVQPAGVAEPVFRRDIE